MIFEIDGTDGKTNAEPETTALAETTFAGDCPVHRFAETFADGEAESRTSVFPSDRRIQLIEAREQVRNVFFGDSNSRVDDFELNHFRLVGIVPHRRDDRAAIGSELDRVGQQVEQNLAKSQRISYVTLGLHIEILLHDESFLVGRQREHVDDAFRLLKDRKRDLFEFHSTRFDAFKVEDVVDKCVEVIGAIGDYLYRFSHFRSQRRREEFLCHRNDSVQRSSKFMTHVSQELALGIGGEFEFRVDEFLLLQRIPQSLKDESVRVLVHEAHDPQTQNQRVARARPSDRRRVKVEITCIEKQRRR